MRRDQSRGFAVVITLRNYTATLNNMSVSNLIGLRHSKHKQHVVLFLLFFLIPYTLTIVFFYFVYLGELVELN